MADDEGESDRRTLRSQYRELLQHATTSRQDLVSANGDALHAALAQADSLHARVKRPREQAVDSEVLCRLAECGVELSKKLRPGPTTHSVGDVLGALRMAHVGGMEPHDTARDDPKAFDWRALGSRCAVYGAPVTTQSHMMGPLNVEVKARKVAQRREKERIGPAKKVETTADIHDERLNIETEKNMKELAGVMQEEGTATMAQVMHNQTSFAQTVENAFAAAFLVRDGRLRVNPPSTPGAVATMSSARPPTEGDFKSGTASRSQFVLRLSMADWEQLIAQGVAGLLAHRAATHGGEGSTQEPRSQRGAGIGPVVGQENAGVGAGKDGKARAPRGAHEQPLSPQPVR